MKNFIIYSILILIFSGNKETTKANQNLQSDSRSGLLNTEIKPQDCYPKDIEVYLNDPDNSGTNIRENPNGKIITTLIKDELNSEYILRLTEAKNGWFRIKGPIIGTESDIKIPNQQGWIHGSVISVETRNYRGEHLKLLDQPNEGKTIITFKNEVSGLRLKDICGDWVQVEYKNYIGWIESKWLCGNPLTNCS